MTVFALDPVGNSSPVAQKGIRSNYRSTRIFKNTLLNKFVFLGWAEYCLLVLPIGPYSFRLESLGPIHSAWIAYCITYCIA